MSSLDCGVIVNCCAVDKLNIGKNKQFAIHVLISLRRSPVLSPYGIFHSNMYIRFTPCTEIHAKRHMYGLILLLGENYPLRILTVLYKV